MDKASEKIRKIESESRRQKEWIEDLAIEITKIRLRIKWLERVIEQNNLSA